MKALMVLGAILGFLIGAGFGLAGRTEWPSALWNACAAACAAGLLMRWWGGIWLKNLEMAIHQRRRAGPAVRPVTKPSSSARS